MEASGYREIFNVGGVFFVGRGGGGGGMVVGVLVGVCVTAFLLNARSVQRRRSFIIIYIIII
jgi:hypothetical protein